MKILSLSQVTPFISCIFFLLLAKISIALDKINFSLVDQADSYDSLLSINNNTDFIHKLVNYQSYFYDLIYQLPGSMFNYHLVDSYDLEALLIEGMDLGMQGNYNGAIEIFSQIIKLNPQSAEAYYNRGFTYVKLAQLEQAIADYNQAIVIKPDFAEAYLDRAIIKLKMGDKQESLQDLLIAADLFKTQNNTYAYNQVINLIEQLKIEF